MTLPVKPGHATFCCIYTAAKNTERPVIDPEADISRKLRVRGSVANGMALLGKSDFLVAETTVAEVVRRLVFGDQLRCDFIGFHSI